jgi:hypothetical protein
VLRYLFTTLAFVLFLNQNINAQEFKWKAGFLGFFDNREYFNEYAAPQSIFGSRAFLEGGFSIDENNEFGGGINYLYEFGSETSPKNISPILYYHYDGTSSELYMGAFPRHNLVELPNVMLSDTFYYYRPNVEGIYVKFNSKVGTQNVWIDWTSRQTKEHNETFIIGATGTTNGKVLYGNYHFMMYHHAGTAAEGPSLIRDNGGLAINLGTNLTSFTKLDSLSISSGVIGSYDRLRAFYDLEYRFGSLTELYAEYKGFGLRSALYIGEGQNFMLGDQLYTAPRYNRTDLIYKVFRKGSVKGFVEFSTHFLPGEVNFSQKFLIYVDISGRKKL